MANYDDVMLKTALIWAEKSKCLRGKVGAVIAKGSNIISQGYNGTPRNFKREESNYDCEDEIKVCPNCNYYNLKNAKVCANCDCNINEIKPELRTRHDLVIHAELNAILNAARLGHSTENATLYVTMLPCSNCAIAIAQAGIKKVIYINEYKNSNSKEIFKKLNIKLIQKKII